MGISVISGSEANEPTPPRADQDQEIAQSITATLQLIERIEHNPNIAATLGEAGYDADKLQEGKVLSALVQEHFDRRQEVLAQRNRLGDQLAELEDVVKKRHKLDQDVVVEGLKRYVRHNDRDIQRLYRYAEKLRVRTIISKYIEVLL